MTTDFPFDREAELGVIGACLDGSIGGKLETALLAAESLPSKCFYHDDTRFIYECIVDAVNHGRATDELALRSDWKSKFPALAYPQDASEAQDRHSSWSLEDRSGRVLKLYRRRQAMMAAHALLAGAAAQEKPLENSIAEFESIMGQSETNAPAILDGLNLAKFLNDDLERRHSLDGRLSGIDTGFQDLNRHTDGLQLGEFWIVGARPSVGKTALALNIADHVALTLGVPCLFVSLEMSAMALCRRLLSMRSGIHGKTIRTGKFTEKDFQSMPAFMAKLKNSPLKILDSPGGIGVTQLCSSVRASIRRWGIKVVFIDYLQKIRADKKGEKRTYEIGDVSSKLVELTKRENVNMFSLAQLNRENEKDKGRPPRLSDLADSKSIEADADFVGLLDRPIAGDERRAILRIAKQRDGARDSIPLTYHGWQCKFMTGTNNPVSE